MKEKEALKNLLKYEISLLDRSVENLNYSLKNVEHINLDLPLTEDQYVWFDSFSTRFMRTYEVLFNQLIRTILQLLNEHKNTNLDNMNKAEQLNLITSVEDMNEIRKLRNQVAHDYLDSEWIPIYKQLIISSKDLLRSGQMSRKFINDRFPDVESSP